jgi:RES domain-containing protein
MPAPHPDFPQYFSAFADPALLQPWSGDVLRTALPCWVSRPYRLTGVGALLSGGRWNLPKLFPAVCFSTTVATANAEAEAWAQRYGFAVSALKPQTRFTARLEFQALLDLTTEPAMGALGLNTNDLTNCDWKGEQDADREALTQAVGRAAFERMAEGLIVPSARRTGGVNVVLFPGHRRDGSLVLVRDEASIPFMHGL